MLARGARRQVGDRAAANSVVTLFAFETEAVKTKRWWSNDRGGGGGEEEGIRPIFLAKNVDPKT